MTLNSGFYNLIKRFLEVHLTFTLKIFILIDITSYNFLKEVEYKVVSKPIVGIIGNSYKIDNKYQQISGTINIEAIAEVSEALPVIFQFT